MTSSESWLRVNRAPMLQWVEALESGDYAQGTGTLRTSTDGGYAYCCLGVACEIFRKATGAGEWDGERFGTDSDIFNSAVLPRSVKEWLGVEYADPALGTVGDEPLTATSANDEHGLSFKEIAAYLRQRYLGGKVGDGTPE